MNNLIEIDFKPETADDYLVTPFLKAVNDKNFAFTTNEMKIIVGKTGQGKTYHTANTFIPDLIKKGVKLIVVTVPQTEILDGDLFIDALENMPVHVVFHPKAALKHLKKGRTVCLVTSHNSLVVQRGNRALRKWMMTSGDEFAIFVDEAHTWLISNWLNYRDVQGAHASPSKYEAKLFKALEELSKTSPYIFGMTATPNGEQLGKIDTVGTMKFKVINEMAPLHLTIPKSAYLNKVDYLDLKEKYDVWEKVGDAVTKIFTEDFGKTMMLSCNTKDSQHGYELKEVFDMVAQILTTNGFVPEDEKCIAVMVGKGGSTSHNFQTGVYAVNGSFEVVDEDEVKSKLDDVDDPLKVLIVVNKGQMGMNVTTMKSLISFKPSNKDNSQGDALTEFAIQTLGRLVRLNVGENLKDFTEKWGYDISEYMKTLSLEEKIKLITANSFDILVPKTDMWVQAVDKFGTEYVSTIQQAKAYWTNNA